MHPTAGITGVGARFVLVAYNVNLDTKDLAVAKEIAVAIREKNGGLPGVKAMGFDLPEKGQVQVSMNLVDYRKTNKLLAYAVPMSGYAYLLNAERVRELARREQNRWFTTVHNGRMIAAGIARHGRRSYCRTISWSRLENEGCVIRGRQTFDPDGVVRALLAQRAAK